MSIKNPTAVNAHRGLGHALATSSLICLFSSKMWKWDRLQLTSAYFDECIIGLKSGKTSLMTWTLLGQAPKRWPLTSPLFVINKRLKRPVTVELLNLYNSCGTWGVRSVIECLVGTKRGDFITFGHWNGKILKWHWVLLGIGRGGRVRERVNIAYEVIHRELLISSSALLPFQVPWRALRYGLLVPSFTSILLSLLFLNFCLFLILPSVQFIEQHWDDHQG